MAPGCGGEQDTVEVAEVRVAERAATRAVVHVETTLPTACEVLHGTSESELDRSASEPEIEAAGLSMIHDIVLEDLRPDTKYYFRARVVDRENTEALSEIDSFTTEDAPESELGVNVALLDQGARVASVSSNWGAGANDSSYGGNQAFDGRMATEWSSDGDGDEAWIELDFREERQLTAFAFRSREMKDQTGIIRRLALVFDDQETRGPFDTPDPSVRYEFELEPPAVARRVWVRAIETSGGNTGAREIEFYE
jgi:hypothetical protein